jgi:plastocyanin
MNNTKTISIALIVIVVLTVAWYIFTKNNQNTKVDDNNSITQTENSMDDSNKITSDDSATPTDKVLDATGTTANATVIKEFTVEGSNFKFVPSTILVNKGDTVKINFKNTQGFHDFVVDEFGAATKQIKDPSTETITFVASKVGTFEYYCSVGQHRSMGMKGTLTVK